MKKKIFKKICEICLHLCCFFSLQPFQLGVENISEADFQKLKNVKVGIITNQTGVDQKKNRTIDILLSRGVRIEYIFVPEHGLKGVVHAGMDVYDARDKKADLPVISLYRHSSGVGIDKKYLDAIDLFLYDMQDSGMRHYTYISTLYKILQIAQKENKECIVLDRPNPLGGIMQGTLVQKEFESFVSIAPIPLRHGMTVGELALYFSSVLLDSSTKVSVIKMDNYDRKKHQMQILAPLSPNIQSIGSVYGYSFLGMLGEITPFDVGVGTPHAFSTILLPSGLSTSRDIWHELSQLLATHGIQSQFVSNIKTSKKEPRDGLMLNIASNDFSSFSLFMDIVHLFKNAGVDISFSQLFNKVSGTNLLQDMYVNNISKKFFTSYVQKSLSSFYQKAKPYFLYVPYPEIVDV